VGVRKREERKGKKKERKRERDIYKGRFAVKKREKKGAKIRGLVDFPDCFSWHATHRSLWRPWKMRTTT
jgi:hypothetical protein